MSVLIKGMEMPKSCLDCRLFNDPWCMAKNRNQWRTAYNRPPIGEKQKDCPLVEVPTPHGRLIDLDGTALAQYYDEEHEEWSMETVTVEDILWEVCENMPPTVIPADKDGTNHE